MSKKIVSIILCLSLFFMFTACASDKVIDGKEYTSYGVINKDEVRNENIEYSLVVGNVIWSIILFETIVMPIYFIGFSMYEPVGKKKKDNGKI